jgi:leader peptidase (prepilin peptidase)/N-methyltransferase
VTRSRTAATAGSAAIAFAAASVATGDPAPVAARLVVLGAALGAIASYDINDHRIPNRIVLPACLACAALLVAHGTTLGPLIPGFLLVAGLLTMSLLVPRSLGMGDVKLALLLGFAVGWTVPVALFAGMFAALVPSVVLFARHGAKARKMAIPFAPFLALGGVLALFWGRPLLDWYLGFLH